MTCLNPWMSDRTRTGIIEEDDCGVLQDTVAYPLLITTGGAQVNASGPPIVFDDVTGAGRTLDAQKGKEEVTVSWEESHLYGDNDKTIAAMLRSVAVPEITEALVASGAFVPSGTRLDTTIGPQITAPTGSFDSFINHDGATAGTHPRGGAERLLFYTEGSGTADNNGFRVADAIWDDTSLAMIDLHRGWNAGLAAAPGPTLGAAPGSPIQATAGESLAITLGQTWRDKFNGAGVTTLSMLQQMVNDAEEIWQYVSGLAGNDLVLSYDGGDKVTLQADWAGQRLGNLSLSDPTTDRGFVDSNVWGERFTAANNLLMSVIFSPTLMIPMAGHSQNGLTWTIGGNTSSDQRTSGTQFSGGAIRGSHNLVASMPWTLRHTAADTRVVDMIGLGRQATFEKPGMVSIFLDRRLGHVTAWLGHQGVVGLTAPQSTAVGETVDGTTEITFHQVNGAPQAGMAAYQSFDGLLAP